MVFSIHHTVKTIKMRPVYNIHKPHYIANTILLPFDIKIVRQIQKQRKNGEACQASPTYFWSSLINLTPKGTNI